MLSSICAILTVCCFYLFVYATKIVYASFSNIVPASFGTLFNRLRFNYRRPNISFMRLDLTFLLRCFFTLYIFFFVIDFLERSNYFNISVETNTCEKKINSLSPYRVCNANFWIYIHTMNKYILFYDE